MRFVLLAAACAGLFSSSASLQAHGDLHLQIVELTQQIEKEPKNVELIVRRGELHRLHVEYDHALADFDRATLLDPAFLGTELARARLYLDTGWPYSARAGLDRFLTKVTNHVEAHILHARAQTRLTNRLAAAADYTLAIRFSTDPGPELFIERAQVLAAEGTEHFTTALEGIDEGVRKLGPLVTLQLTAIDLETKRTNYDGAIARLDTVAAKSPRKESWLMRRGELLLQANRPDEAKQAFQAALAALNTLPPTRRNVPAVTDLERRIQKELERLIVPGDLPKPGQPPSSDKP